MNNEDVADQSTKNTNGIIAHRRGRPQKNPTATTNLGAIRLSQWIADHGGVEGIREIAEKVGCDESTVRQWANGRSRPGAITRTSVDRIIGIGRQQWDCVIEKSEAEVNPAASTAPAAPTVVPIQMDDVVAILRDIRSAVQALESYWRPAIKNPSEPPTESPTPSGNGQA